jgi:hypothetical protein
MALHPKLIDDFRLLIFEMGSASGRRIFDPSLSHSDPLIP